jgi:uncharacterized protein YndB with AHSA1/START domain
MAGPPRTGTLEASIEIDCSPKDVWSVLGDFDEVEAWAPALSDAFRTTGRDIGIGSRRTVEYRRLFRMEQVVTHWEDGESLSYTVFKAPWPLRNFFETWTVTPSVSGARVRSAVEYELWFGPVGAFVDWVFVRRVLLFEMRSGLKGLKRTVERNL